MCLLTFNTFLKYTDSLIPLNSSASSWSVHNNHRFRPHLPLSNDLLHSPKPKRTGGNFRDSAFPIVTSQPVPAVVTSEAGQSTVVAPWGELVVALTARLNGGARRKRGGLSSGSLWARFCLFRHCRRSPWRKIWRRSEMMAVDASRVLIFGPQHSLEGIWGIEKTSN